jgi:hypothetical protein
VRGLCWRLTQRSCLQQLLPRNQSCSGGLPWLLAINCLPALAHGLPLELWSDVVVGKERKNERSKLLLAT